SKLHPSSRNGSWPCQNARACGTHRMTFFSSTNVVRAVARQHGNRGAGRTRFPSVNALSEFSHNQGQFDPFVQGVGYGESNTVTGRGSLGDPKGERVEAHRTLSAASQRTAHSALSFRSS